MPQDCNGCRDGAAFHRPFSMAFQPIVDARTGRVYAHEALVRGPNGEGAGTVLGAVTPENRYAFDQRCRVSAIEHASRLGLAKDGARLSINFLPNAVYEPKACIRLTLATARRTGFPTDRLIFEFTEVEKLDPAHVGAILKAYRELGFATAIDDFGAGYAGLTLLAKFQPDIVKLDMDLVRDIDSDRVKRAIVSGIIATCRDLDIIVLGEGLETEGEHRTLLDLGIALQQGYLFGRPAFEALAAPGVPTSALAKVAGESVMG